MFSFLLLANRLEPIKHIDKSFPGGTQSVVLTTGNLSNLTERVFIQFGENFFPLRSFQKIIGYLIKWVQRNACTPI